MIPVPRCSPLIAACLILLAPAAHAQSRQPSRNVPAAAVVQPAPPYADVADLVLKSPVIIEATVHATRRIKGPDAIGIQAGKGRVLVTADVAKLLRGPGVLPAQISYLLDLRLDARGRLPKLRKAHVLLFARPVAGIANQLQLTGDGAQRDWYPALDALTRKITAEVLAADAPPAVTGIGNAFHVPGTLPGEGETQIFLTTADNRPQSLTIIRKPGEIPQWAVAQSEIIDEASAPPDRDTLLWYRLACFLPRALPASSLANDSSENAAIAADDYQFVLKSLGQCTRSAPAGAS